MFELMKFLAEQAKGMAAIKKIEDGFYETVYYKFMRDAEGMMRKVETMKTAFNASELQNKIDANLAENARLQEILDSVAAL